MMLTPVTADESAFLASDDAVDHTHPLVRETASRLLAGAGGDLAAFARAAYEYVRDTIPHSADVDDWRLPWRASDVLAQGIGICHTKSHALVALLRAEGVPAGFCYQKLDVLHGLIALRLPGSRRWVRQDARGNKPRGRRGVQSGPGATRLHRVAGEGGVRLPRALRGTAPGGAACAARCDRPRTAVAIAGHGVVTCPPGGGAGCAVPLGRGVIRTVRRRSGV